MATTGALGHDNVIDADGHVLEPPDVWEKYIDPAFRDRAIRLRLNDEGKEYLELNGRPSRFFNIKAFASLGGMVSPAMTTAANTRALKGPTLL